MTSSAASSTSDRDTLVVDRVSKRFGGLKVFDDVSFEVRSGEVLGVIGPNGAGKTTMINIVCGSLRPTSGAIRLGAHAITGGPLYAVSRLGVVRSFQQTNVFKSASVEENLYRAERFAARRSGPDLQLPALLEEFGLARHLREASDKLPYGLQKMLGLVMALALRPRFLLLDEPAAGLEQRERPQVDRFVRHAQSKLGCGILIVEHDMDLVKRLCPEIVVLESGRILASGAPQEVLARREVIDAYLGVGEE